MNYSFSAQILTAKNRSFWSRIDPRIRLLSFFFFLFLILFVPTSNLQAFAGVVLSLGLMAVLGGFSWNFFCKVLAFTFPWLAFASLSILLRLKNLTGEAGSILANLLGKTTLTLVLLTVYKTAINFPEFIKALSQTKIPPLFLSLLFLSHHFLQVLGEEAQRMNRALASRSWGKINLRRKIKILWGLMNCLFDRAFWRCQRLLASLLSRGFRGRWPALTAERLRAADFLFLLSLFLLTIYIFFI